MARAKRRNFRGRSNRNRQNRRIAVRQNNSIRNEVTSNVSIIPQVPPVRPDTTRMVKIRAILKANSGDNFSSFEPTSDIVGVDSAINLGLNYNGENRTVTVNANDLMIATLVKDTGLSGSGAPLSILKKLPVYEKARFSLVKVTFYFDQENRPGSTAEHKYDHVAEQISISLNSGGNTLAKAVHLDYTPGKVTTCTLTSPQHIWYAIDSPGTTDTKVQITVHSMATMDQFGTTGTWTLGYLDIWIKRHLPFDFVVEDPRVIHHIKTATEIDKAAQEAIMKWFGFS